MSLRIPLLFISIFPLSYFCFTCWDARQSDANSEWGISVWKSNLGIKPPLLFFLMKQIFSIAWGLKSGAGYKLQVPFWHRQFWHLLSSLTRCDDSFPFRFRASKPRRWTHLISWNLSTLKFNTQLHSILLKIRFCDGLVQLRITEKTTSQSWFFFL